MRGSLPAGSGVGGAKARGCIGKGVARVTALGWVENAFLGEGNWCVVFWWTSGVGLGCGKGRERIFGRWREAMVAVFGKGLYSHFCDFVKGKFEPEGA